MLAKRRGRDGQTWRNKIRRLRRRVWRMARRRWKTVRHALGGDALILVKRRQEAVPGRYGRTRHVRWGQTGPRISLIRKHRRKRVGDGRRGIARSTLAALALVLLLGFIWTTIWKQAHFKIGGNSIRASSCGLGLGVGPRRHPQYTVGFRLPPLCTLGESDRKFWHTVQCAGAVGRRLHPRCTVGRIGPLSTISGRIGRAACGLQLHRPGCTVGVVGSQVWGLSREPLALGYYKTVGDNYLQDKDKSHLTAVLGYCSVGYTKKWDNPPSTMGRALWLWDCRPGTIKEATRKDQGSKKKMAGAKRKYKKVGSRNHCCGEGGGLAANGGWWLSVRRSMVAWGCGLAGLGIWQEPVHWTDGYRFGEALHLGPYTEGGASSS